jgi:hypothetical protein
MFASTNSLINRLAPARGPLLFCDSYRFVGIDVPIQRGEDALEIGKGQIDLAQPRFAIDDANLEPVERLQSEFVSDRLR